VAICTGQFQKPNMPQIKGIDTFKGAIYHSSDYTNVADFEFLRDKSVLFVGMGESAADIVTELSAISENSLLSIKRYHVFSAKKSGKLPIDVVQSRHWHSLPATSKTSKVKEMWAELGDSTTKLRDKLLSEHILAASDEPGSVVTKSERIFEAQAQGMEIDVGGITEINGSEVSFKSGKTMNFDAIMFCTGFKFDLPFLEKNTQFEKISECYLHCFHPNFGDEIAFIGFARPQQGGVPLISELLARYFALICSGERKLPPNLNELAKKDAKKWRNEFYETPWVHGLVNGFRFNDQVADLIGCRPKEPSFIFQPKKFWVYWMNHVRPSQYRLRGPGNKQIAKDNWLKADSIHSDLDGLKLIVGVFKLKIKICIEKIKSKFIQDQKHKWRPIFK